MRLFISIFFSFCFGLLGVAQKTAIAALTTSQDVLIQSQNIQTALEFLAFGSEGEQGISRSILKLDLKDLPIGTLKHATLSLTMASEGAGIISIHKVLEEWKGSDYDLLDYANWETTGIGQKEWSIHGGDFHNLPSGRAVFNDNETLDIFGPRMKLDIEQWIEDPSSNFGWLIKGAENASNSKTLFHSGKNLTQGPILTLIFELPDTCYALGGTARTKGGQTVIAKCPNQAELKIDLEVQNPQGENKIWLTCNEQGDILGFSIDTKFNPLIYGEQNLNIYHLSFNGEILGASVGSNIRNLVGCHELSNKIEVLSEPINGGDITTTSRDKEVTICPINLEDIENLKVENHIGVSSLWAVIDHDGIIQILGSKRPTAIKDLSAGNYQIRHLSYQGNLSGLSVGSQLDEIIGCYDWSNAIDITLLDIRICRPACSLQGSLLKGEELKVCPHSSIGVSFDMDSLSLSDNHGPYAIWIITDRRGNTLEALPDVDLSGYKIAEGETVYLFHVTYEDLIFQFRNNIYDLNGCYGISNGLPIKGVQTIDCPLICELPNPVISSNTFDTEVDLCQASIVEDLEITSTNDGSFPSLFIVRNSSDSIIAVGDSGMELVFKENGIYSISQVISYEDSAFIDFKRNILNAKTCFAFSNEIHLIQSICPFICETPKSITVTESGESNVFIRWERIEGAKQYEFEVGFDIDTTDLTRVSTGRNWIQLANPSHRPLIFRVRTKCDTEDFSPYSEFIEFTSSQSTIATSRNSNLFNIRKRLGISPNPASSIISLQYETFEQATVAEIYDATGRLQLKLILNAHRKSHAIDISKLKTGVHFLKMRGTEGNLYQEKFIKVE